MEWGSHRTTRVFLTICTNLSELSKKEGAAITNLHKRRTGGFNKAAHLKTESFFLRRSRQTELLPQTGRKEDWTEEKLKKSKQQNYGQLNDR